MCTSLFSSLPCMRFHPLFVYLFLLLNYTLARSPSLSTSPLSLSRCSVGTSGTADFNPVPRKLRKHTASPKPGSAPLCNRYVAKRTIILHGSLGCPCVDGGERISSARHPTATKTEKAFMTFNHGRGEVSQQSHGTSSRPTVSQCIAK